MHHLFYVENGISLALVIGYIKEKKLSHSDIVLLLGRGLKADVPFETKDASTWEFRTSVNFIKGWSQTNKTEREIEHYLATQKIDKFHFYTSSISKLSCYFLLSHSKNKSNCFIEDGRSAYYSEEEFKTYIKKFHFSSLAFPLFQFKSWLNYRFKHYPNPNKTIAFIKKMNNAIVSSEHSLSYITNRYIVASLFKNQEPKFSQVQCLMCLSYPVEDGLIQLPEYKQVLIQTFDHIIKQGITEVHYKFHPQQLSNPKNLETYLDVISLYKDQISFTELPKETIMETVMSNSDAVLLSDYSSIMIYTANFGNKIISNFGLIQANKTSNKGMPLLPKVLTSIIHKSNIPLSQ
jgi:hypothetical protein